MVSTLIQHGANVNENSSGGETPLVKAAERGDQVVCSLLLEKGANINRLTSDEETLLICVLKNGRTEENILSVLPILMQHGNDIHAKTYEDTETALWVAVRKGYTNVCFALINHGANFIDILIHNERFDKRYHCIVLMDFFINAKRDLSEYDKKLLHQLNDQTIEDKLTQLASATKRQSLVILSDSEKIAAGLSHKKPLLTPSLSLSPNRVNMNNLPQ